MVAWTRVSDQLTITRKQRLQLGQVWSGNCGEEVEKFVSWSDNMQGSREKEQIAVMEEDAEKGQNLKRLGAASAEFLSVCSDDD